MNGLKKCALLILSTTICGLSEAANHYCTNRHMVTIHIDSFYHRDETIVPRVVDEPLDSRDQAKSCRWTIGFRGIGELTQLILIGSGPIEIQSTENGSTASQLTVTSTTGVAFNVTAGLVQTIFLRSGDFLVVEASWDPKRRASCQVSLRIVLPIKGHCAKDMLSFRGTCYYVSETRQDLTGALSSFRGNAQLASFSNLTEIRALIDANNGKSTVYPYKRPLILNWPVRIGLFRSPANNSLLSVVRTAGRCEQFRVSTGPEVEVLDSGTGPCGAMINLTESGKPVIEFSICSKLVRSLLSFPETGSSEQCSKAYLALAKVPHLIRNLSKTTESDIGTHQTRSSGSTKLYTTALSIAASCVTVLTVAAVLIALKLRQKFSIARRNFPERKQSRYCNGQESMIPVRDVQKLSEHPSYKCLPEQPISESLLISSPPNHMYSV